MKISPVKAAKIKAEYDAIVEALKQTNFHKSKAAELLKIDRKTLYSKLKRYREVTGMDKGSRNN